VSDTVLYDKDGQVVTITYHRPERMNAINGQMREELNAAWLRFRDDTDAWVAILTGAGRAFCAGADIREGGAAGTFAGTFWEKPTINSFESGLELFKPTIAAINGPCLGYGVTAVSFCDFVIASQPLSGPSACHSASSGPMPWNSCLLASQSTPSAPGPWGWCGKWCRTMT
jgi:E-phenylitaconyl-CoA hydratase